MDLILGIETSCDETAAAVVADGFKTMSNIVSSQIARHAEFGGVVPELAAREHLKAIRFVTDTALEKAAVKAENISAVAVTAGPGLMPALLVGVNFARGLALSLGVPVIGVNHFTAHIYGAFLDCPPDTFSDPGLYPVLALVVSGGHTALVLVRQNGSAEIVGSTLDDAAGEAFDKAAKLLGLGYPGGPAVEKAAAGGKSDRFRFPRPLTGSTGRAAGPEDRFNFSFSGVKTALLYHCKNHGGAETMDPGLLADTAASFQEAVVDSLFLKTADAAKHFGAASVVVSGGVACNKALRERFASALPKRLRLVTAPPKYCADNAAMVAGSAWHTFKKGGAGSAELDAFARLPVLTEVDFCGNGAPA
jgi:N6-L-threonylcarbamoyladenine synthase